MKKSYIVVTGFNEYGLEKYEGLEGYTTTRQYEAIRFETKTHAKIHMRSTHNIPEDKYIIEEITEAVVQPSYKTRLAG